MLFDKLWLQLIPTQLFKLSNAKVSKQLFDPIVRKGSSRQYQRDPKTSTNVSGEVPFVDLDKPGYAFLQSNNKLTEIHTICKL